jgi:hypothetical protein
VNETHIFIVTGEIAAYVRGCLKYWNNESIDERQDDRRVQHPWMDGMGVEWRPTTNS